MSLAIQPADANFNDPSLPILGYDRLLNGGTMALIDFANTNLYPSQNETFTGVANGVPGKPTNVFVQSGGTHLTLVGGGMTFPSGAGGTPGLKVGTMAADGTPTYDLSTLAVDTELLLVTWFNLLANPDSFERTLVSISDSGSGAIATAKNQLTLVYNLIHGLCLYVAGVEKSDLKVGATINAAHQFGVHVVPKHSSVTTLNVYYDGVSIGSTTMAYVAPTALTTGGLALGNAKSPGLTVPENSRIYRMFLENITRSTRDPARQVALDYSLNNGRFS
jgi:hypothetical protein